LTNRTEFSNKALSQVVSTLILLVVAVLLAAVVAYYATNVTTTRTTMEEVHIGAPHVWVNSTGGVAACKVENLGGRDILIDKLSVRSVDTDWDAVYIFRVPGGTWVSGDMNVTSYDLVTGTSFEKDGRNYTQMTSDIPLISGAELLVYVKGPRNIQMDDIGTTVSLSVTTNNAQYITECNVKSANDQ
jgi:hypothetical protein